MTMAGGLGNLTVFFHHPGSSPGQAPEPKHTPDKDVRGRAKNTKWVWYQKNISKREKGEFFGSDQ